MKPPRDIGLPFLVFAGPVSARIGDRVGNGATMALGSALVAAAASLNRTLVAGRGRANALYVLCYDLGGSLGITAAGHAYRRFGRRGVAGLGMAMLTLPFAAGLREPREGRRSSRPSRHAGA